ATWRPPATSSVGCRATGITDRPRTHQQGEPNMSALKTSMAEPSAAVADTAVRKAVNGGAAPDELVPSRYALRVGEIDVLVVSDGVVTPPAESMATNADPAIRGAWLDDMFLSRDVFDWALNAVVVRSGGRTILIDSGLGMEVPDFPRAGQ